jgi:arylformamidase
MTASTSEITKAELEKKDIQSGERILFKTTNSQRGFETFYADYIFLSGDAAEYLAEKGVKLVGIDALSIKQKGSPDTRPHTVLLAKNIPILEGINLIAVTEGIYHLIVLPLKFMHIDGSPARAILLKK